MNRLAIFVLLAALAAPAFAQSTIPVGIGVGQTVVFTTVDAVQLVSNRFYVTGVVEGEAAASTRYVTFNANDPELNRGACERLAVLALERPGRYRLEVAYYPPNYQGSTCKLVRANP